MAKIKPDEDKLAALKAVTATLKDTQKYDEFDSVRAAAAEVMLSLSVKGEGGADWKICITPAEAKAISELILVPRIKAAQQAAKKGDILLDESEEALFGKYGK